VRFLNNASHDRWTVGDGSTAWRERLSNLNPLDFYLWERHLLITQRHFTMDCECLADCPQLSLHLWMDAALASRRAWNIMEDILSICYRRIISAIIHNLIVFGHMLSWICFLVLACAKCYCEWNLLCSQIYSMFPILCTCLCNLTFKIFRWCMTDTSTCLRVRSDFGTGSFLCNGGV
jgi:hypothetical protein